MKFIVKQAAEAPAEKPVELSITLAAGGQATVRANGSPILAFMPDGHVSLYGLTGYDHAHGFVADRDGFIKICGRKPI